MLKFQFILNKTLSKSFNPLLRYIEFYHPMLYIVQFCACLFPITRFFKLCYLKAFLANKRRIKINAYFLLAILKHFFTVTKFFPKSKDVNT